MHGIIDAAYQRGLTGQRLRRHRLAPEAVVSVGLPETFEPLHPRAAAVRLEEHVGGAPAARPARPVVVRELGEPSPPRPRGNVLFL
jgi:hypothetical protein